MKKSLVACLVVGLAVGSLLAITASAAPSRVGATNITLQLKWVPQAQFAGYYAAVKQGFYAKEGLNVTLKNGGPNIIPEQVVASGQAQFGVDWLPSLLATRDTGTNLVNIAQMFARAGMTADDIDLFEINEAFAAVVLRFLREMKLSPDKVNVNGGAIAMGHPLGATGAMILGSVLDELERRNLTTALVTLCIGAGMGTATIIERV